MEPLASRIRPRSLHDFVGQEHLTGAGKPLRLAIEKKELFSFVLWGPREAVKLHWRASTRLGLVLNFSNFQQLRREKTIFVGLLIAVAGFCQKKLRYFLSTKYIVSIKHSKTICFRLLNVAILHLLGRRRRIRHLK